MLPGKISEDKLYLLYFYHRTQNVLLLIIYLLNLARLTAFPNDEETFRSWYFTLVLRSYQKDDDIVKACSCTFSQSNATTQIV